MFHRMKNILLVPFTVALATAPAWAFNADIKTVTVNGGSADASPLALRFFSDAGFTVPAPLGTTVWFVADKGGNGVPTTPAPAAILGADDVILHRDVVDGDQPGSRAGGFRRLGVTVPEEFRTAPIYVYVWNGSGADFTPGAGSQFGLHRLGVVPVPDIGNAAWLIDQNVFTGQHTVGGGSANQPPTIGAVAPQSLPELAAYELVLSVSDPDAGQVVSLSLGAGAPAGLTLDSAARKLSWTPSEAQGPGEFSVKVIATDNGSPAAATEVTISLSVTEVNTAPRFAPVAPRTVEAGQTLEIPLAPADDDLPAQTLSLSLLNPPPGVGLTDGIIRWTPAPAQAGNHLITAQVADSGSPAQTAQVVIEVTVVAPPLETPVLAAKLMDGSLQLTFATQNGRSYQVQGRVDIGGGNWANEGSAVGGTGSPATVTVPTSGNSGFYRVTVE